MWGVASPRVAVVIGLALAIVAAGQATAATRTTMEGPVEARMGVSGTFVEDARTLLRFEASATRLDVDMWTARFVDPGLTGIGIQQEFTRRTFTLTDATMTLLRGGADGWVGIESGNARGTALALDLEAVTPGYMGTTAQQSPESGNSYHYEWGAPAIQSTGWATLSWTGEVAAKLSGPDVRIVARENTTTWTTGTERDPTPPGERTHRWMVLRIHGGTLTMEGAPAVVVSRALDADGPGELASFSVAEVSGAPSLVRSPRASPLGEAAAPAPPQGNLALVLLAVVVGGAAGALLAMRRGRAKMRLEADTLADLARAEAEAGRMDAALDRIGDARRLAPTSARLGLDEAGMLEQAGRTEEAVALLGSLAGEGVAEAHLALARTLASQRADAPLVASRIAAALAGAPVLLLEVEADALLAPFLDEPAAREAVAKARRALR